MSSRAVHLTILALLLLELASGLGSFLVGRPEGAWVFWLHALGGLSLVVLLTWKWRIVLRSFARRGAGPWSIAPGALGVLMKIPTISTSFCEELQERVQKDLLTGESCSEYQGSSA